MTDDLITPAHEDPNAERRAIDRADDIDDREVWRKHVDKRLDDGAATMKALRADMAENTATTKRVQADTSELVELLTSFKGAFSVLESIAKLARPLGFIAAAVAAFIGLWTVIKGGGK